MAAGVLISEKLPRAYWLEEPLLQFESDQETASTTRNRGDVDYEDVPLVL
jgi:hypothetical protein